jgi:hypothetical protein
MLTSRCISIARECSQFEPCNGDGNADAAPRLQLNPNPRRMNAAAKKKGGARWIACVARQA